MFLYDEVKVLSGFAAPQPNTDHQVMILCFPYFCHAFPEVFLEIDELTKIWDNKYCEYVKALSGVWVGVDE